MAPTTPPPRRTVLRARVLRGSMTYAEKLLWARLRGGRLDGLTFRRQHPIGPYILDFFHVAARLAVEVDGPHHEEDQAQIEHDWRRDAWLARQGVKVLRLSLDQVTGDMEEVLGNIRDATRARLAALE